MGNSHEEFEQLLLDGTDLLDRGSTDQAMSRAMEALTLRPGNPLAENLLGLALFARRRFRESRDIFEGLVRRHPDIASLRINAGLTALRTDGAKRAADHFRHVLKLEPDHRRALAYLALLSFKSGDRAKTRSLLQKADLDELANRLNQPLDDEATLWLALDIEARADQLPPGRGSGPQPPRAFEGFSEVMPLVPGDSWSERPATDRPGMERMTKAVEPVGLPRTPAHTTLTGPYGRGVHTRPTVELSPPPPPLEALDPTSSERPPRLRHATRRRPTGRQTAPLWPVPARAELAARNARSRYSSGHYPVEGPHRLEDLILAEEDSGLAAEVHSGVLMLRLGEACEEEDATGAIVRQDRVVLHQGTLDWEAVQRRRMGAVQGPFEVEGAPVMRVGGDGVVLLHARKERQLNLLQLREDALFMREEVVAAFSSVLFWENGRIPGLGSKGPQLVHLKGTGFLALETACPVQAYEVHRTSPVVVRLSHLLGWTADVVPQLDREAAQQDGDTVLRCSGPGLVLIGGLWPAPAE